MNAVNFVISIDLLSTIAKVIIEHQLAVVGPLAIEQANKVTGIKASDGVNIKVEISGDDAKIILTDLVERYQELFGLASVEVCKDAVKEVKPPVPSEDLPEILK